MRRWGMRRRGRLRIELLMLGWGEVEGGGGLIERMGGGEGGMVEFCVFFLPWCLI